MYRKALLCRQKYEVERRRTFATEQDADVAPPKLTVKPLKSCEKERTFVNKKKSLKRRRLTETGVKQAYESVAHNGWQAYWQLATLCLGHPSQSLLKPLLIWFHRVISTKPGRMKEVVIVKSIFSFLVPHIVPKRTALCSQGLKAHAENGHRSPIEEPGR